MLYDCMMLKKFVETEMKNQAQKLAFSAMEKEGIIKKGKKGWWVVLDWDRLPKLAIKKITEIETGSPGSVKFSE